jgi:hypothetical protein
MGMREANTKTVILGMMVATCYAAAADATIIYNTAGTTNVATTVNDNIIVDNSATTVNVGSGGTIRGVNDPSLGIYNAAARTRHGTLNVNGTGRIIAAAGQDAINMTGTPSVVRLSNHARVSGNIVNEFTPPGWQSESTSVVKLYLEDRARVTGDIRYAGYMRIDDRAQVIGNIINPRDGSYSLDMRGGQVTGQVVMGDFNDYVFNMSGGTIYGGLRGSSGFLDMTMSGGTIHNGFRTGDAVTASIYDGTINGGFEFTNDTAAASHITIDGGQFNATAGDYLFWMSYQPLGSGESASLDIYGGEFGYVEAGLGFFLDYLVDFSIYGWDLTYTGGVLSGYLLDGSWFSNALTFGAGWAGTFNIYNVFSPMTMAEPVAQLASLDPLSSSSMEAHNVPEPGTFGLLAACAVGMMMFGRRSTLTSRS